MRMAHEIRQIGAILLGCGLLLASAGCSCSLSCTGAGFVAWGERSEQLVPGSCGQAEASSDCPHGEGCTNVGCRRGLIPAVVRGVQRVFWCLCPGTCHTCGRVRSGDAHGDTAGVVPPGVQEHSRYHPLPTQPVFSPRVDDLTPMAGNPARGKSGGAARVQTTAPMPEEPQETVVPSAKEDDRTTRAPRPLATPSSQQSTRQATKQPSSWVFAPRAGIQPPPAPEPELPLEPKDRMKTDWKAVRR
jgi:hypothetical protein